MAQMNAALSQIARRGEITLALNWPSPMTGRRRAMPAARLHLAKADP